jgi:hypothetical protein
MILITNIASKHGYSGFDHLIDDGPLHDLIGQAYRSVADIRRAVKKVQIETADARVKYIPVGVEIELANGNHREIEA